MVRTFKNPQGGSLGGCFEAGGTHGAGGNGHHAGDFDSSRRGHAIDYDDLLNQKRRAELQYRNGVDPFIVNGSGAGMKGSSSETFLTRVAEPPPAQIQEDFGLANGLNDLSNVNERRAWDLFKTTYL